MIESMFAAATALLLAVSAGPATATPAATIKPPPHQVIALYFHRTQRCPTCRRIGDMAEKAVTNAFPEQLKSRAVEFRLVDFQDEQNAALVKAYRISGPTLMLVNVFDGKAVRWAPLPRVWQLFGKPEEFQAYVQSGVARFLAQTKQEAEAAG